VDQMILNRNPKPDTLAIVNRLLQRADHTFSKPNRRPG